MIFVQTIVEVIILYNGFYGYPIALGFLFDHDSESKDYFMSLPEEVQQALINEDIHSSYDLHDYVERLRMKE